MHGHLAETTVVGGSQETVGDETVQSHRHFVAQAEQEVVGKASSAFLVSLRVSSIDRKSFLAEAKASRHPHPSGLSQGKAVSYAGTKLKKVEIA